MTQNKLTAENATIKTASVEVKALTISGRQVTLAVFRQLPLKSLIQPVGLDLNGLPWGHVNYHADKCAETSEHLHVVWQQDERLLRACVYRHVEYPYWGNIYTCAKEFAFAKMQEALSCEECDSSFSHLDHSLIKCSNRHGLDEKARIERKKWLDCWTCYNDFETSLVINNEKIRLVFPNSEIDRNMAESKKESFYKSALDWLAGQGSPTSDDALRRTIDLLNAKKKWVNKYEELYQGLAAMDQLYIAI